MSSAIEVLKTMLEIRKKPNLFVSECCKDPFEDRKIVEANALGEAIVALEKQERLKEWLEKEIKENENWLNTTNDCLMPSEEEALEAEYKIKFCKEVLEKVGEQK